MKARSDTLASQAQSIAATLGGERSKGVATLSDVNNEPINILIVDDEPKNLTVLETVLDDPSYRLIRAGSAEQALQALVVQEFALLILDIGMPSMTGFELAQMVRERKKTAQVPIIFLTAYYNEDQHVLAGYGAGAVDYLHKPVNPVILRSKVAVFADLHRKTRELGLSYDALLAEVTQRTQAQIQLRELNETLELRVTERTESLTRTSAALRYSEQLHRIAFDLAPTGMAHLGLDESFTKVNESVCEITGYAANELIGMKASDLTHPDDREADARLLQVFLRGDTPIYGNEMRYVRKDGSLRWVAVTARMLTDHDGRPLHSICVIWDISDRKAAREQLRASEEFNRSLMDGTTDCVKVMDLEGRLLHMNAPGMCQMEIDDFATLKGRLWWSLWPDEMHDVLRRAIEQAHAGIANSFTGFRPTVKGTTKWWNVSVSPVCDTVSGEVARLIAVSRDVTEARQIEQALREADEKKDNFIATLAHELRNPLAPIRNAVTVMRQKGSADPQLIWCRDVIERQVGQMAHLLEDLLDVSRITRAKLTLRRESLQLATVIEQSIEIARPFIDAAGHVLTITLPPQPIALNGDLTRLAQVVSNLLINAAKYTGGTGHIGLSAQLGADEVTVTVKDNGIGIDAEHLPQVFEMFGQVNSALERSQGGLGIGLSLSKGLVDMHGGELTAHSEGLGKGSEFVVHLPLSGSTTLPELSERRTSLRPHIFDDGQASVGEKCRILVADDLRDSADSLALLLESMGNEVCITYDGEEALRMAEVFRPDVAFIDLGMPKLNGYEVCRGIREQAWGERMALVAQTGWGQEEDRRRTREAGFDYHMVKPIEASALDTFLRTVVTRNMKSL